MKWKFYSRMLLASFAALSLATACSDDDDDKGGNGGGGKAGFTLNVTNIAGYSATLQVTPTNTSTNYLCGAVEKSAYTSEADFLAAEKTRLQQEAAERGMTLEIYLKTIVKRGSAAVELTLTENTDYVAFAYAVDAQGAATSKVATKDFNSGEGGALFTVDVTGTTAFTVSASVTTITDSYWFFQPMDTGDPAECKEWTESFFAAVAQANPQVPMSAIVEQLCQTGDQSFMMMGLDAGTTYYPAVMGVDENGKVSTDVVVGEPFTTKELSKSGDIALETSDVTPVGVTVKTNPASQSDVYFASILDKKVLEEQGNVSIESLVASDLIQLWAQKGGWNAELLNAALQANILFQGAKTIPYNGLDPETEYVAVALYIDSETGEPSSKAVTKEFTTTEAVSTPQWKAWIGDWTVTSAGSVDVNGKSVIENDTPISFDVKIEGDVPGISYKISDWTLTVLRDETDPDQQFPISASLDGEKLVIENDQQLAQTQKGYLDFCAFTKVSNGQYSWVTGPFTALTGELSGGKGTVTGAAGIELSGGQTADVLFSEYVDIQGDGIGMFYAGEGYTDLVYAKLPYTMTKSAAAATNAKKAVAQKAPTFNKNVKRGISVDLTKGRCALPAQAVYPIAMVSNYRVAEVLK